jgi:hypothetical protein
LQNDVTSMLRVVVGKEDKNSSVPHSLSINRPTKRGKEQSPSDGLWQCQKEMDDHLQACQ